MQEQLVIESHGKRDLNQMRSLRLPSEDPRIERPLYMKGERRPPEMVCQGFMPLEHEKVEEQTCTCKNNGKRCQNRYTCPKSGSSLDIKRKHRQQCCLILSEVSLEERTSEEQMS